MNQKDTEIDARQEIARLLATFDNRKWDDIDDTTTRFFQGTTKAIYLRRAGEILDALSKQLGFIQLSREEAMCFSGRFGCGDCKGAFNGDFYCQNVHDRVQAKLATRLGMDLI